MSIYLAVIVVVLLGRFTNACNSQSPMRIDTMYGSKDALITVKNYGAYIARFTLRYRIDGDWKAQSSEYFLAGQTMSLLLPPYASRPHLIVQNMVFIEIWRTVYEAEVSPWNRLCITIGGTTLNPTVGFYCYSFHFFIAILSFIFSLYDPHVHLDLRLPEYIVNLKFEKIYLKDLDLENENDIGRLNQFLNVGLAFASPFKVLSDEGLKVVREIIDYHVENTPNLSKHTGRHAWCMRGLAYVSRFIRDFNRCEVVAEKMSVFAGKPLNVHAMPLSYSHINIGVAGTGKKVDEWHLDSVGFVLVVIISEPRGVVGGELQVLKHDATSSLSNILDNHTPDQIMNVNYDSAGNGAFMQGSHIYHQVTPVLESTVGPRISLVNSFMTANVFDEDCTKFAYFRDGDPHHVSYLEYARLVAWRASGMLEHLINHIEFDGEGKKKAIQVMEKALNELKNGCSLLKDEDDDSIDYYDSEKRVTKTRST